MKNSDKVSYFSIILLLITSAGLMNHVIMIPVLLEKVGRDAWISVLLVFIILLVCIPAIFYIVKKLNKVNIFHYLKDMIGSFAAFLISILICIYLIVTATITIYDLANWTIITYLPVTPHIIIVVLFATVCFLSTVTSLRTLVIMNGFLLPIIIILGFFVAMANNPRKDFSLLLPILENGMEQVINGMVYVGAGFIELVLLLFIQHKIHSKIKIWPLFFLGFVFCILTLGPLIGAIVEFGAEEAGRLRFPAYEEWALVTIGRFVEHVDFMSIYQWLSGAFIRISFLMFLIPEVLNIQKKKTRVILLGVMFLLMISLTQIPINDPQFLFILAKYLLPISLVFLVSLFLILLLIVLFKKKKGTSTQNETF